MEEWLCYFESILVLFFYISLSQAPNKILLACFLLKHEFRRQLKKKKNNLNESFISFYEP